MTDSGIPTSKIGQLKLSISNLIDEYARTTPILGTLINAVPIAVGVGVWHYTTGIPSVLGILLAVSGLSGILKWVIQH